MHRYHLNLFNDVEVLDDEGAEFPGLPAAKAEAIRAAREILAEAVSAGRPLNLDHNIKITDDDGKVLVAVPFREVITILNGGTPPN